MAFIFECSLEEAIRDANTIRNQFPTSYISVSTQKILSMIGLLALPLMAQTKSALFPAPTSVAGIAASINPSQNNNLVPRPEASKPGRTMYGWSVAAALGANAADAATSWRAQEANRVLAGNGSQFGVASLAIKSGLVGTSLLIQQIALRHRPDMYKRMAWMNFVTAGVLGGVASHNMNVR